VVGGVLSHDLLEEEQQFDSLQNGAQNTPLSLQSVFLMSNTRSLKYYQDRLWTNRRRRIGRGEKMAFSAGMPPGSSCNGEEDNLGSCFQAQVAERIRRWSIPVKPYAPPAPPPAHPCLNKIIVGCSDETDSAVGHEGSTHGTWVIGADTQEFRLRFSQTELKLPILPRQAKDKHTRKHLGLF
jgi:hypothetical protein